jgi:adiponectin receptor
MEDNEKGHSYDRILLEWAELHPWMRDNEYLQTNYRRASNSYRLSLLSITRLHNETVNIWSHILGALAFIYSLYHLHTSLQTILLLSTWADLAAISIYYLSVINCFLLSATYHLLSNHSNAVHTLGNKLDHLGIVLVIYGSTFPALYFEFYCQPTHRNTYGAALTVCALLSCIFTLRPEFRTSHARRLRVLVYVSFALACFLPVIHGLHIWSYAELDQRMGLRNIVIMALCQFSGGVIYATRIPERWSPRTFDIWGASHQIMHILVLCGAFSLEAGWIGALHWWHREGAGRAECAGDAL